MPHKIFVISLLSIAWLTQAAAYQFTDEYGPSEYGHPDGPEWREGQVKLPEDYQDENLQQFQIENSSGRFRYFIDRSTLQTSEDGVTRYLLVVRSSKGVDNISYEGIRCGMREYKAYAYGTRDGLKLLRKPAWRRIAKTGPENYHNALYSNLLCSLSTGKPNLPESVFKAMAAGQAVEHFLFNQD